MRESKRRRLESFTLVGFDFSAVGFDFCKNGRENVERNIFVFVNALSCIFFSYVLGVSST